MKCSCGNPIIQPARGRRRTKCEKCSPKDKRVRTERAGPKVGSVVPFKTPTATGDPPSMLDTTRAVLAEAGREESWQGAAALKAARTIDAGEYAPRDLAVLLKAHRDAVAAALEGTGKKADVIDLIFGEA